MPTTTDTRNNYGSQTPSLAKLNNGELAYISRLENKLLSEHDVNKETKECPRCEKNRLLKFFGTRVMRETGTGKVKKVIFQSYCIDCRSARPESKPKTKRGQKAKTRVVKRVRKQTAEGEALVLPESAQAKAQVPAATAENPVVIGSNEPTPPPMEIPATAPRAPEPEVIPEAPVVAAPPAPVEALVEAPVAPPVVQPLPDEGMAVVIAPVLVAVEEARVVVAPVSE